MRTIEFSREQLINKRHPIIVEAIQGGIKSEATVTISGKAIVLFTVAASELCGLRVGSFVHFYHPDKHWYFLVNNDPNGFKVSLNNATRDSAVRISSKAFVQLFRDSTGRKENCTFFIQRTRSQVQGFDLYEILTDKSKQELRK